MVSKIIAIILFILAPTIVVCAFMFLRDIAIILSFIPAALILVLIGIISYRHGAKQAIQDLDQALPDYLRFR